MKTLFSIEVDYHEATGAEAKILRILNLIEDVYSVRSVEVYADDLG